jgi:hypothetical protein
MSSNPTQPKFGDQGEGVNFPPEDDAEGHAFNPALAEGDGQPEGFRAWAEGDGQPEGFRAHVAGDEDDTEGHKYPWAADRPEGFVDGRAGGQPEAMEPVPSKEGFAAMADADDTEGHQLRSYSEGGKPQDGPEGLKPVETDGEKTDGPDGLASL